MDAEIFSRNRALQQAECARIRKLTTKYKKELPRIDADWDTSSEAIKFNNISQEIIDAGICTFRCSLDELFSVLHDRDVFEAVNLWKRHDNNKLTKVIENWEHKNKLSPIFLVKHGSRDLVLLADGNHRLSVLRATNASTVTFMVTHADAAWIISLIPSAVLI